MSRKTGETKPCKVCEKEQYFATWQIKKQKNFFCSRECYEKDHAQKPQTCNNCGKVFYSKGYQTNQKYCSISCGSSGENNSMYGKNRKGMYQHTEEAKKKISESHKGAGNPNWRGGKIPTNYRRHAGLQKFARENIPYKCTCGCEEYLQLHHIVPRRDFSEDATPHFVSNLIYLCETCHKKTDAEVRRCLKSKQYSKIPYIDRQWPTILDQLEKDGCVSQTPQGAIRLL